VAAHRVEITRSAHRDLDALNPRIGRRILTAIAGLAGDARPHGCRKLTGSPDSYRLRVGDYRILYVIDDADAAVTVFAVGHRRDIYR
jgi:mRNA interferase RelE/StbE